MKYSDYYRDKLKQGTEYQDFVYDKLYTVGLPILSYSSKKYQLLYGENKPGIEIKFDDKLKDTGNLYIETQEKSDPANEFYIKSGIFRNDNSWLYVVGDYSTIYIFSKTMLKILFSKKIFREITIPTSIGFLIPKKEAEKYVAKIILCDAG